MTRANAPVEIDAERLRRALDGRSEEVTQLVALLTPVVQARVARALLRRPARDRDIQQDVADLTQEVFVALFSADARSLRSWEPARGLSLLNFVGLLAERRVASLLRTKRYDSTGPELNAEASTGNSADGRVVSRMMLERVLESLQSSLSARGLELFHRLYVQEQSVEEICAQTDLQPAAVHQWRHRLRDAARAALNALEQPRAPSSPRPEPNHASRSGEQR